MIVGKIDMDSYPETCTVSRREAHKIYILQLGTIAVIIIRSSKHENILISGLDVSG